MKILHCTVLLALAGLAHGETLFNDRASWEAANNQLIVKDGFDADIGQGDVIVFASGASATGSNPQGTVNNAVVSGLWELRVYNPGGSNGYSQMVIDLPEPVISFGLDILSVSSSRGVKIRGDWNGTGEITTDLWSHFGATSNGFFGVIGDAEFDQVTIFAADGSVTGDDFMRADELSFEDTDAIFIHGFE